MYDVSGSCCAECIRRGVFGQMTALSKKLCDLLMGESSAIEIGSGLASSPSASDDSTLPAFQYLFLGRAHYTVPPHSSKRRKAEARDRPKRT